MAHYYDPRDYSNYGRTGNHADPTSEYGSSGRTLGSYPATTKTDTWAGDTWHKTDHDATYDRSTPGSYQHVTWTDPPKSYAVSSDNWQNKQSGTAGRTYDRRGSFDEYVMRVATDYIKPSGQVSSSYVRSQKPNEYTDYYKKDLYKSSGYQPRSEYGSNLPGAPMSDPTNNIGLAMDYLQKEGTGSTAPSSQYVGHGTQQYVETVEPIVDPLNRYGNKTYFRRR